MAKNILHQRKMVIKEREYLLNVAKLNLLKSKKLIEEADELIHKTGGIDNGE